MVATAGQGEPCQWRVGHTTGERRGERGRESESDTVGPDGRQGEGTAGEKEMGGSRWRLR